MKSSEMTGNYLFLRRRLPSAFSDMMLGFNFFSPRSIQTNRSHAYRVALTVCSDIKKKRRPLEIFMRWELSTVCT